MLELFPLGNFSEFVHVSDSASYWLFDTRRKWSGDGKFRSRVFQKFLLSDHVANQRSTFCLVKDVVQMYIGTNLYAFICARYCPGRSIFNPFNPGYEGNIPTKLRYIKSYIKCAQKLQDTP